MKTLYITDLDGTLLQPDATISAYSIHAINELIGKGTLFSIATARSIASAKHIIRDLHLNLPVVLMNGACIYDFQKEEYLRIETLSGESIEVLMKFITDHQLKGFAYTIKDGILNTFYEKIGNEAMQSFYQERVTLYQKRFTQINHFSDLCREPLLYFTLLDDKEVLEPIYKQLLALPELNCTFYKDNYTPYWYLEIFNKAASKFHAVQYLRSYLQSDKIVCFGDNRNDFPLFEAGDFRIAVGNAVPELKAKAHLVIGKNVEDGVANWMKENIE